MASKKGVINKKYLLATLVTGDRAPCAFCRREVDDEFAYGKLYAIGNLQCHYYCALLSCCLVQKGKDTEGLFGFLYPDIVAEVERSKKHKCSYCGMGGASLGCCVSACRKQFHLPCGRDKRAMSLFYGNYKSYCQQHAPKQKIPEHIMSVAKLRMKMAKSGRLPDCSRLMKNIGDESQPPELECVCVICYETVPGYPSLDTFWPICCAKDAWFHRTCLQRMALSAGMHYLKCPLCNDKEQFYNAFLDQGYYVPDRDAAWELEQNAFAEIYERPLSCSADNCLCPNGREHDADSGSWDIKLCILCGTSGCHVTCLNSVRFICSVCAPAAPKDIEALASTIDNVIRAEQAASRESERRPVMPSRMSLRRTKGNIVNSPSTSTPETNSNTTLSRRDLNINPPRKPETTPVLKNIEYVNTILSPSKLNKHIDGSFLSPVKLLKEKLDRKIEVLGVKDLDSKIVVDRVRDKLRKPRPLSEKKRVVNDILEDLFNNILKDVQSKKTSTPKKIRELPQEIIKSEAQKEVDTSQEKIPKLKDTAGNTEKLPFEGSIDKFNDGNTKSGNENVDPEDSTNRFHVRPEFVADNTGNITLFETPKKLKTVEIEKNSSLEISENDQVVNIDMIKMENMPKTPEFKIKIPLSSINNAFKFNPVNKVNSDNNDTIDVERYKNLYLNEVDRDFKCQFNHKHNDKNDEKGSTLRTAIDFAIEATKKEEKKLKRKLEVKDGVGVARKRTKKIKKSKDTVVLNYKKDGDEKSIDVTVNSPENKKRKKSRENIQVKIKFKKEQVKLQIVKSKLKAKKKNKKLKSPNLKQYVLKYAEEASNAQIVKPEKDITPMKRKYVKLEKTPDNMVQTSIQSFFKKVSDTN